MKKNKIMGYISILLLIGVLFSEYITIYRYGFDFYMIYIFTLIVILLGINIYINFKK
jgi:hypothetical protein